MVEARYRGQKVVVVSPDYAEHTKFADHWPAAERARTGRWRWVTWSCGSSTSGRQVPYFRDYARRFTDLPLLGQSASALLIWLGLVPYLLRHWRTPTIGASFILTVATESLALLAATLAFSERSAWLLYAALAPFCLGLGSYLLVLWWLTIARLPALLAAEAIRPRFSYNVRRWSTVFPVGMYAACSFVVGTVSGTGAIPQFARVWVWVGVAVWLTVFLAMLSRGPQLIPSA